MSRTGQNSDTVLDQELVHRFQSGDQRAFDELILRHQTRVLQLCYRFLYSIEDAKDAGQDIFIKAYQAAQSFQPQAQFSTWLYRICVNECLNRLRSRKRRKWLRFFSPANEPMRDWVDEADNPQQAMEKKERRDAVRRALQTLPEEQRTAVILHRYEGLSYHEIAQITSSSVSAVESRLHRAKKKLTTHLAQISAT